MTRPETRDDLAIRRAREATRRMDEAARAAYPFGQEASTSEAQHARHPELSMITREDVVMPDSGKPATTREEPTT